MTKIHAGTRNGDSAKKFLNRDPFDTTFPWKEWHIQSYIIQEARRAGYMVSGSMEQGLRSKASGARAKATGMSKGEPDLRFYLPEGRLFLVELKAKEGVVSKAQEEYHKRLRELGHCVEVVKGACPGEVWDKVKGLLEVHGECEYGGF